MIQTPPKTHTKTELNRMGFNQRGLSGERALLAAVVSRATVDYLAGDAGERLDAARYFSGPIYRKHLEVMGLPGDWLPELVGVQSPIF